MQNKKWTILQVLAHGLLWLYLWVVFVMQFFSIGMQANVAFFLLLGLFAGVCSRLLLQGLDVVLQLPMAALPRKWLRYVPVAVFAGTLLMYGIFWQWQYPGGTTTDSVKQLHQAITGQYNNWHPVLHTLLFMTLPYKLGCGVAGMVFLQLVWFSGAFAYVVYVLAKHGFPKQWLWILCGYVWVNPFLTTNMMFLWKDIALVVFALLAGGFTVEIVCTKGAWLRRTGNCVLLGVVLVLCCYMRHNGILFAGPMGLIALCCGRPQKKTLTGVFAGVLACVLLVQGTYSMLQVEKPDKRVVETIGLPATIWCHVMQKSPHVLPEETREVMYTFASQEEYQTYYQVGDFNSIKFKVYDTEAMDKLTYPQVAQYTLQCITGSFNVSMQAAARLTRLVWGIDSYLGPQLVYMSENDLQEESREFPDVMHRYFGFFDSLPLFRLMFGSYGLINLLLVAVLAWCVGRNQWGFVHAIPLLCYNFGTMLLLSGEDYRFFLMNLLLWMPTVFLMCRETRRVFPEK